MLPTINAPASQMSSAHEVLNPSLTIMQSLSLKKIVCTFDQALYAKAAEIIWKHSEQFQKTIIIRLGAFHTLCTLLATIRKRFQDAGLRDLGIESGIIAEGSNNGVMDGRKYNRAVRLHKLVYEAMIRLAWKGFRSWLELHYTTDIIHMDETFRIIDKFRNNISQTSLNYVLKNDSCARIMKLFRLYLQFLRHENEELSSFWISYIDMIKILLNIIRASREGDWLLHLASIRSMIPWLFAYDRINYARSVPYFNSQMSQLPTQHPDIYDEFMAGRFSVQIGSTNLFGKMPVDQTIEETVNKKNRHQEVQKDLA